MFIYHHIAPLHKLIYYIKYYGKWKKAKRVSAKFISIEEQFTKCAISSR